MTCWIPGGKAGQLQNQEQLLYVADTVSHMCDVHFHTLAARKSHQTEASSRNVSRIVIMACFLDPELFLVFPVFLVFTAPLSLSHTKKKIASHLKNLFL